MAMEKIRQIDDRWLVRKNVGILHPRENITYQIDVKKGPQESSMFTARWWTILEYLRSKNTIPIRYDFLSLTMF